MYANLDPVQDFTCCLCCKRDNPNFELCDRRCSCKSYWFYNIVASVLHLLNAVLMVVLFYIPDEDGVTQKDVCYQLYMPYASWTPINGTDEFVITQKAVDTHTLSGAVLLTTDAQPVSAIIEESRGETARLTVRSWLIGPRTYLPC